MRDSGVYHLKIRLERSRKITVGRLGILNFPLGYYVYTGSAKKNLQARLARHREKRKRFHWHIDYLLKFGKIEDIWVYPWKKGRECSLNKKVSKSEDVQMMIPRFGSSDCGCVSHLVYFRKEPHL